MTFCFKLLLSCRTFLLPVETDPISKGKLFYLISLADFGGKSEKNFLEHGASQRSIFYSQMTKKKLPSLEMYEEEHDSLYSDQLTVTNEKV